MVSGGAVVAVALISFVAGAGILYASGLGSQGVQTKTTTQVLTTTQSFATTVTTVGGVPPSSSPKYYLGINGINGEVSVLNYSGMIALNSWSWGPPKSYCSPGGPAGTANCTSVETTFNFTSITSKASPAMQQAAAQGRPISSAILIGVDTIAGQETVVVKFSFTNLFVSSYSSSGQGNLPVDQVTMVFSKVVVG